jgi:hypothetical protein
VGVIRDIAFIIIIIIIIIRGKQETFTNMQFIRQFPPVLQIRKDRPEDKTLGNAGSGLLG